MSPPPPPQEAPMIGYSTEFIKIKEVKYKFIQLYQYPRQQLVLVSVFWMHLKGNRHHVSASSSKWNAEIKLTIIEE